MGAQIAGPAPLRNTALLGLGVHRPERIVTNHEICQQIDSSDEWIQSRSGIKERRFAEDTGETVLDMAISAGRKALEAAGITGDRLGAVIVATSTYPYQTPQSAALVADALGTGGAAALDISAGCAGFCYALGVASDLVRAGTEDYALVIGVERMSDTTEPTDRSVRFIFGDGAGAVVVGPTEEQELGPVVWGSDGSQFNAIRQDLDWVTFLDSDRKQRPYLRLEGTAVFRWAAFEMGKVAHRALEAAKIGAEDLDVFVPHQANARINELLARSLKLREDAVVANDIEYTGNTSAASIPLAIEDLLSTGKAQPGQTALLLGFGAGLSYASQVVKLPPVPFE